MKEIEENGYGVKLVWLAKNEDYPGTSGITGKQGYYICSPNQGESWEYLGIVRPTDAWWTEMYEVE